MISWEDMDWKEKKNPQSKIRNPRVSGIQNPGFTQSEDCGKSGFESFFSSFSFLPNAKIRLANLWDFYSYRLCSWTESVRIQFWPYATFIVTVICSSISRYYRLQYRLSVSTGNNCPHDPSLEVYVLSSLPRTMIHHDMSPSLEAYVHDVLT